MQPLPQGRESTRVKVALGFGSHWLRKWRGYYYITQSQNEVKRTYKELLVAGRRKKFNVFNKYKQKFKSGVL